MASLSTLFTDVLTGYPTAVNETFKNHPVGKLLRVEVRDEVNARVADATYLVKGSAGSGRWAETPWVAVFDPLVTTSAERGHYVVYLFRGDGSGAYLSLNQGTTAIKERVGKKDYLGVLETNARAFAKRLPDDLVSGLILGPIELPGEADLTPGYEAGNIVARFYPSDSIPDDLDLASDLKAFLELYRLTVETSDEWGATGSDDDDDDGDVQAGIEGSKMRWHKRTERNRKLAKDAKKFHGYTCKVCGFNFEERYGEIGAKYIEAHHLTPLEDLAGRPTELDPRTDFTVACCNCHRMLHRTKPPLTVEELSGRLR